MRSVARARGTVCELAPNVDWCRLTRPPVPPDQACFPSPSLSQLPSPPKSDRSSSSSSVFDLGQLVVKVTDPTKSVPASPIATLVSSLLLL